MHHNYFHIVANLHIMYAIAQMGKKRANQSCLKVISEITTEFYATCGSHEITGDAPPKYSKIPISVKSKIVLSDAPQVMFVTDGVSVRKPCYMCSDLVTINEHNVKRSVTQPFNMYCTCVKCDNIMANMTEY